MKLSRSFYAFLLFGIPLVCLFAFPLKSAHAAISSASDSASKTTQPPSAFQAVASVYQAWNGIRCAVQKSIFNYSDSTCDAPAQKIEPALSIAAPADHPDINDATTAASAAPKDPQASPLPTMLAPAPSQQALIVPSRGPPSSVSAPSNNGVTLAQVRALIAQELSNRSIPTAVPQDTLRIPAVDPNSYVSHDFLSRQVDSIGYSVGNAVSSSNVYLNNQITVLTASLATSIAQQDGSVITNGTFTGTFSGPSLTLSGTAPATTTNTLYQSLGTLYWNGAPVASGGGGSSVWGGITGTLANQTDLSNALALKLNASNWYSTTTDGLAEGVNPNRLYYSDARARGAVSSSATGLTYTSGSGAFSLTSGYVIPLTASTTNWQTAYNTVSSSQGQNLVFASPNGSSGAPTFRSLVASDIPTLNQNTTGTALNVTGIVAIANGGTGTSTAPGVNQLLIGNSLGGYSYISTSSLGISSGVTSSFSTTSADYYVNASTTIPKTYTANAYSALQTFNVGLTANAFTLGSLSGPLQAVNGAVSASSTLSAVYGGTGISTLPSYGQVLLGNANGGYTLSATSSLGLTSSQWTTVGSNINFATGNVGIGTTTPYASLSVDGRGIFNQDVRANYFTATSTTLASTFTYASTTALSAQTICLTGDTCRTSWPSGSGSSFSTTSADYYTNASTTIPKTYTANAFSALQTFNAGLTANAFTLGSLNGPLQAINGVVSASSTLSTVYGGTGVSTFGQGWIFSNGGTGALSASTSPTLAYITATSTTATSTFAGGLSVAGANGLTVMQNGNVGIGTSTPAQSIDVKAGGAYGYDGSVIAQGITALSSYFFAGAGNMTSTGSSNTATGKSAFTNVTNGGKNSAYGFSALADLTTGTQNTAIGYFAGSNSGIMQTVTDSTFIGSGANSSIDGVVNSTAIGKAAQVTQSNQVVIGNTSVTQTLLRGNVGIGTTTPYASLSVDGRGIFNQDIRANYFIATSTTLASTFTYASTTALSAQTICLTGDTCRTSWPTGGGTNYLTSSTSNAFTYLNTGTTLQAAIFNATSTTGTSTFAGGAIFATSGGSVGIGTTSPYAMLSVDGRGIFNQDIRANYFTATSTTFASFFAYASTTALSAQTICLTGDTCRTSWPTGGAGTSYLTASSSSAYTYLNTGSILQAPSFNATSTTATSTFAGDVSFGSSTSAAAFTVDYNGYVGIGTSTPWKTLSVTGDMVLTGGLYDSLSSAGTSGMVLQSTGSAVTWVSTSSLGISGGAGSNYFTNSGANTYLSTGSKLGVGTTTPAYALSIVGGADTGYGFASATFAATSSQEAGINLVNYGTGGRSYNIFSTNTASGLGGGKFVIADVGAGTSRLAINSTGYVGIGSTSPGFLLSVAGNGYYGGNLTATGTLTLSALTGTQCLHEVSGVISGTGSDCGSGGTNYFTASSSSAYTYLNTGTTLQVPIFNATSTTATSTFAGGFIAGNGGLTYDFSSLSTSIQNLQMGNMSFDTDAGQVSWIDLPITSSSGSSTIESYSANLNGSPILTVYGLADGSGNINSQGIGIGTTTPATTLDVGGDLTVEGVKSCNSSSNALGTNANGKVVCNTSLSDERLKGDITNLDSQSALNVVNSLNPVSFYWIDQNLPGTGSAQKQFGFIAQDVAKLAPNLVATTTSTYLTPDGTFYLNYQGIIPLLTKAIQAQQKQIGTATSSLAALAIGQSSAAQTASTTALTLASLSDQMQALSLGFSAASSTVTSRLDAMNILLAAEASSSANLASSTAAALATSTSFIQAIANAVLNLLQSSGQIVSSAASWTVGEIHSTLAVFTHVDTETITAQTASVTNGLEMTDSTNGQIYCVRIAGGDFAKTLGKCAAIATSTALMASTSPIIPIANPVINPIVPTPPASTTPPVAGQPQASSTPSDQSSSQSTSTPEVPAAPVTSATPVMPTQPAAAETIPSPVVPESSPEPVPSP